MLENHDPALITSDAFRASLWEVVRRGVPFDVPTFPRHLLAPFQVLPDVPGLRSVVDHMSKPEMTFGELGQRERTCSCIASHPNLSRKISGMVTEAGADWSAERIRPCLSHVARAFGPDRLILGTDSPVCTLAATHSEVTELARAPLADPSSTMRISSCAECCSRVRRR